MNSLASLAAKRTALVQELIRTQEIGPDSEAKIAKLLEKGALGDPKVSTKLGELRTNKELAPIREAQLQAEIVKFDADELRPAIIRATRQLAAVAGAERPALLAKIHSALLAFIPDLHIEDRIVGEVYMVSPAYRTRIAALDLATNHFDRYDSDMGESAACLLKLAAEHKLDLDKLPEPPAPTPQSENATAYGSDYVPRKLTRTEQRHLEEDEAREAQGAGQEAAAEAGTTEQEAVEAQ